MCVCVFVCVRACVRVCVRAYVRVCVRVYVGLPPPHHRLNITLVACCTIGLHAVVCVDTLFDCCTASPVVQLVYTYCVQLSAGDAIGTVANTSWCQTPHLHVAMRRLGSGNYVDPTDYVRKRKMKTPKWHQDCDRFVLIFLVSMWL